VEVVGQGNTVQAQRTSQQKNNAAAKGAELTVQPQNMAVQSVFEQ
jgi:hypothetical protein